MPSGWHRTYGAHQLQLSIPATPQVCAGEQTLASAVWCPPLQRTQERGTHRRDDAREFKSWATRQFITASFRHRSAQVDRPWLRQCGSHPCKGRKTGTPTVGVMYANLKAGPPAQKPFWLFRVGGFLSDFSCCPSFSFNWKCPMTLLSTIKGLVKRFQVSGQKCSAFLNDLLSNLFYIAHCDFPIFFVTLPLSPTKFTEASLCLIDFSPIRSVP
jgi:hypothetical protein